MSVPEDVRNELRTKLWGMADPVSGARVAEHLSEVFASHQVPVQVNSVGSLFAELRPRDHVVAIDADTAFGRLSSRIDPRSTASFWAPMARGALP